MQVNNMYGDVMSLPTYLIENNAMSYALASIPVVAASVSAGTLAGLGPIGCSLAAVAGLGVTGGGFYALKKKYPMPMLYGKVYSITGGLYAVVPLTIVALLVAKFNRRSRRYAAPAILAVSMLALAYATWYAVKMYRLINASNALAAKKYAAQQAYWASPQYKIDQEEALRKKFPTMRPRPPKVISQTAQPAPVSPISTLST